MGEELEMPTVDYQKKARRAEAALRQIRGLIIIDKWWTGNRANYVVGLIDAALAADQPAEAEELAHRAGEFDEAAAMRRRERRDPRYAAVPRLGGGWGVIDYHEGRYLEMTEREDEPQQLTAERLARELNASEPTPNLAAIVAEINDWHRYATDPSVDRDARATATLNLGGVMLDHWPAIRAAMQERAELERKNANQRALLERAENLIHELQDINREQAEEHGRVVAQRAERSTNEPPHTHQDVAGGGYDRRCLGCVYEDGFQQGWLASARSRLARSAAAKEGERG